MVMYVAFFFDSRKAFGSLIWPMQRPVTGTNTALKVYQCGARSRETHPKLGKARARGPPITLPEALGRRHCFCQGMSVGSLQRFPNR